jgi:hypothetical protein
VASNNETEQTGAAELFAAAELHYFNQTEIWPWDHVWSKSTASATGLRDLKSI